MADNRQRMVLGDTLRLTAAGIALGIPLAWLFSDLVESLLFGVGRFDPVSLAAVVMLLVCLALMAGYFPARRAAGIDPVRTLRLE